MVFVFGGMRGIVFGGATSRCARAAKPQAAWGGADR